MRLFSSIALVGIMTVSSYSTTLKEVIDLTLQNNENIKALKNTNLAKQKSFESVDNIYKPTLNIGANLLKLDGDTRAVQVETTTTGFVKFGVNLYDGGSSSSVKKQKKYEYEATVFNSKSSTKDTLLQVVTLYFNTKTVIENIKVFQEKSKTLKAQYDRMKQKYDMQMVTIDEVLKLQSEYETNQYQIEELQYQKEELLNNLSLLTGSNISTIDSSKLPEVSNLDYQISDSIKSLQSSIKAQEENQKIVLSVKKPQIKLEDTYNIYRYDDYNEKILNDLPDQQNQFMLSVSFNIFDTTTKSKAESIKLEKLASQQKLIFAKKNENIKFQLAKRKLKTQKLKLLSLKSAVKMGNSVYNIIKEKYQNGIVDNITYLDALSKKIYNLALYKQALNDYEISKANYYFSSGVDYKKIIDEKF